MRDLDKALADIFAIRSQIAAGTAFRGYGPATVAATGALALATAVLQHFWLDDPAAQPLIFFAGWALTALVSAVLIGVEMLARSRREHLGLADAMMERPKSVNRLRTWMIQIFRRFFHRRVDLYA